MMTDRQLLQTNLQRHLRFDAQYNPITGQGSMESRFAFHYDKLNTFFLPCQMQDDIPLLSTYLQCAKGYKDKHNKTLYFCEWSPWQKNKKTKIEKQLWRADCFMQLMEIRCKYDFEYWAYKKVNIVEKETGNTIAFRLRYAQRKLLHELEALRLADKPIRIIVDKARQWGGSTCVQFYMMWIQLFWRTNWNSAIAGDVNKQSENIKWMYENAIALYPNQEFKLKNTMGGNVKEVVGNGSKIYIGSMQNPNALRSGNYAMAHYSEVGIWQETNKLKPVNLIQSISGSIVSKPYTVIVMESTAKGEGNYFHKQWLSAVKKESNFVPVFVAWWEIETYQHPFEDDKALLDFYHTLKDDEYFQFLWSLGATLEGIHWYYNHKAENGFSDAEMHEEFPSTWEESFISSGERVFPKEYTIKARRTCSLPKFVGELRADERKGEGAYNNLHFEALPNGCLKIWDMPDTELRVKDRYVISMDIGGTSKSADYTVIRVFDRYWRMQDGCDELVAQWRGHYDIDLAVWKAAQLGKFYNNALLAVESNTIDSKYQHTEGDHTYTVFDEIAPYYNNLYIRTDEQRIINNLPAKYGFFTSAQTKDAIITNLKAMLREERYIERDNDAVDELDYYEYKDNRTMGAKEGQHDDIVMATAIGLYVSEKEMPIPTLQTAGGDRQHFSEYDE